MSTTKGTLYMIPCPIGDEQPSESLPAVVLATVARIDHFVVENVRSARRFISACHTGKAIDSLHFEELNEHTPPGETGRMIAPMLQGHDVGMISEAGVPGVADPGGELALACHRHGIKVVPLVGPSSILMALMASGQNGQSFAFNGYLPVKPPERSKAIRHFERRAITESQAQVFIEAPYRNDKLLAEILTVCNPATLLTIAAGILSNSESIVTATIETWRRTPHPDINKRPAIFIIGAPQSK